MNPDYITGSWTTNGGNNYTTQSGYSTWDVVLNDDGYYVAMKRPSRSRATYTSNTSDDTAVRKILEPLRPKGFTVLTQRQLEI